GGGEHRDARQHARQRRSLLRQSAPRRRTDSRLRADGGGDGRAPARGDGGARGASAADGRARRVLPALLRRLRLRGHRAVAAERDVQRRARAAGRRPGGAVDRGRAGAHPRRHDGLAAGRAGPLHRRHPLQRRPPDRLGRAALELDRGLRADRVARARDDRAGARAARDARRRARGAGLLRVPLRAGPGDPRRGARPARGGQAPAPGPLGRLGRGRAARRQRRERLRGDRRDRAAEPSGGLPADGGAALPPRRGRLSRARPVARRAPLASLPDARTRPIIAAIGIGPYSGRMASEPLLAGAAAPGLALRRAAPWVGAVLLVLLLAAVAAALTLSGASLAGDSTALAKVSVQPLGGTIEHVEAFGPTGRRVPMSIQGGLLTPTHHLHPGERISVAVRVKRPGWLGWALGSVQTEHLTVTAPVARLKERWLTVAQGRPVTVAFQQPVSAVSYESSGATRTHRLGEPASRVSLGARGAT